jgi:glycosyltransferase involved in cell wall biosynthesis
VDDVRPWYRAASVLLLASNNEGFGRVVVEAMSSGVPVIANRSGGVSEIINHGLDGILVTSENTKEITEAIKKFIDNEELRDRIKRGGKNRARFFDLPKHVTKMVDVFEDTVAAHY